MSKLSFIETNGAIETAPTTLEQIWGSNDLSKYGTDNEDTYLETLLEMNRSDLEMHARSLGLMIPESSEVLRNRLITEFKKYNLSFRIPVQSSAPLTPSKEVQKILNEGR